MLLFLLHRLLRRHFLKGWNLIKVHFFCLIKAILKQNWHFSILQDFSKFLFSFWIYCGRCVWWWRDTTITMASNEAAFCRCHSVEKDISILVLWLSFVLMDPPPRHGHPRPMDWLTCVLRTSHLAIQSHCQGHVHFWAVTWFVTLSSHRMWTDTLPCTDMLRWLVTTVASFFSFPSVQQGNFNSSIGSDGYMLSSLTCGMSPVTSITEGLQQVSCALTSRQMGRQTDRQHPSLNLSE